MLDILSTSTRRWPTWNGNTAEFRRAEDMAFIER